jgi:hypothetical protein
LELHERKLAEVTEGFVSTFADKILLIVSKIFSLQIECGRGGKFSAVPVDTPFADQLLRSFESIERPFEDTEHHNYMVDTVTHGRNESDRFILDLWDRSISGGIKKDENE